MATAVAADSAGESAVVRAHWSAAAVVNGFRDEASGLGIRAKLQKVAANAIGLE